MQSRITSVCFILFMVPLCAWATTHLYYSVGKDTGALYSDSARTLNGSLTLKSAAAPNIGVGDEVRVGADCYYIRARNSATSFQLQSAARNGRVPGDTAITFSDTLIGIYRAFNSLNGAVDSSTTVLGARDSNHLDTSDLAATNFALNIACYGDGADGKATIRGWTTSDSNFIRIFTPACSTEAGISQRHSGVWDTTKYCVRGSYSAVNIQVPNVHIEGLQISTGGVNDNLQYGINAEGNGEAGLAVSYCIIRLDPTNMTNFGSYSAGIYVGTDVSGLVSIYNNIIYDFNLTGRTNLFGIAVTNHVSGKTFCVNNTVYNCQIGYKDGYEDVVAVNNIAQRCDDGFLGGFNLGSDYNVSDVASDKYGSHSKDSTRVSFKDPGLRNLLLSNGDLGAKDAGTSFGADSLNLSIADISGRNRNTRVWDIGADEVETRILSGDLFVLPMGDSIHYRLRWDTTGQPACSSAVIAKPSWITVATDSFVGRTVVSAPDTDTVLVLFFVEHALSETLSVKIVTYNPALPGIASPVLTAQPAGWTIRPFSAGIRFQVKGAEGPVSISIFDLRGRCQWKQSAEFSRDGIASLKWDTRKAGSASGVYLAVLDAPGFRGASKVLVTASR